MKEYGKDLQKRYLDAQKNLTSAEIAIKKKFNLILDQFREHLTDQDKDWLIKNGKLSNITYEKMLEVIINTEANYVSKKGTQTELFTNE